MYLEQPRGLPEHPATGRRRAAARAMLIRVLDVVPGARRTLADLLRIEVIDRSMVIAAQGLLALTPLLIVVAAFLPDDLAASLGSRFEDVMGIEGSSAPIRDTLSADQVQTQTGVAGFLLALASAISFAKAIQRMHERVWERPHFGGLIGMRRCFVWLIGWLLCLQLVALVGQSFAQVAASDMLRLTLKVVLGTLVWWWTAHALLLGRVRWNDLLCGALLTAIGSTALVQGSRLVMPRYVEANVAQFGPLGLIFAVATWLIAFGGVMVVSTVLGRVLTEDPRIRGALASALATARSVRRVTPVARKLRGPT